MVSHLRKQALGPEDVRAATPPASPTSLSFGERAQDSWE